jgi:hypothetical protein
MNFDQILTVRNLLFVAGLLHFCQVPAMIVAPRMLGWADDLSKLQPINRRIVKVMGLAIMIVVLGTGVVVMIGCSQLADGGPLAVAFCTFLGVFWLYRGLVQVVLYRRIWPGGVVGQLSHHGLTLLFFALTAAYLFSAATVPAG